MEEYLKARYGDRYTLERFYLEADGGGPTSSIFFIHSKFEEDNTDIWELIIRMYNMNGDSLEYLLKNIAGEEAGKNTADWIDGNLGGIIDSPSRVWTKMSDKIEVYHDPGANFGITIYLRNIQSE